MLAIGTIEFSSIARGIGSCDVMVKAANVSLLRASTVCPGKYIVIVSGDTGNVKAAMEAGRKCAAECLVDDLLITNASVQLIPAISMTNRAENRGAIGVIELYSVASAIAAADTAAKAANITLIEVRAGYAIGGKGYVTLTGSVGDVKTAVDAAASSVELVVGTTVIPRPSPLLFDSLL